MADTFEAGWAARPTTTTTQPPFGTSSLESTAGTVLLDGAACRASATPELRGAACTRDAAIAEPSGALAEDHFRSDESASDLASEHQARADERAAYEWTSLRARSSEAPPYTSSVTSQRLEREEADAEHGSLHAHRPSW